MVFRNQDLRHVDVAILYALGQKDRAQYIARRLKPSKTFEYGFEISDNSGTWDSTLKDGAGKPLILKPQNSTLDPEDCPDCKRKRSNITWTGEPPKCVRHSEYNVTWVE